MSGRFGTLKDPPTLAQTSPLTPHSGAHKG